MYFKSLLLIDTHAGPFLRSETGGLQQMTIQTGGNFWRRPGLGKGRCVTYDVYF